MGQRASHRLPADLAEPGTRIAAAYTASHLHTLYHRLPTGLLVEWAAGSAGGLGMLANACRCGSRSIGRSRNRR